MACPHRPWPRDGVLRTRHGMPDQPEIKQLPYNWKVRAWKHRFQISAWTAYTRNPGIRQVITYFPQSRWRKKGVEGWAGVVFRHRHGRKMPAGLRRNAATAPTSSSAARSPAPGWPCPGWPSSPRRRRSRTAPLCRRGTVRAAWDCWQSPRPPPSRSRRCR